MSLDKKLIGLGPAAASGRTSDLGSDPFSDGNCILWIDFESSIEDETGTQTLTANGSITLSTDQVMFDSTSGYFDSTGVKNISGKDSITFPAGDSGLSDLDGWTNSNDFSLSIWVYWEGLNSPSSEQGNATVCAITNGTGIICSLKWNDSGDANKILLDSYGDSLVSDTALNINAWNHIVYISPTTNSSTEAAEIYLNGVRVGYETDWDRSSRNYYDSIGGEFNTVNNNSNYFNGYMDNLRIFKDRLTASEVLSLYNEGLTGVTNMDYLIVAGGGAGGRGNGTSSSYPAGGGGAGGLRTSYGSTSGNASGPEPSLNLEAGTYTITVGAGATANTRNDGDNSSIQTPNTTYLYGTITAEGGGTGSGDVSNTCYGPNSGGSGGGGGCFYLGPGNGTAGQGFKGGGQRGTDGGGGGGGAGEKGSKSGTNGGGGDGVAVNILSSSNASSNSVGEVSGSDVYYAAGGGGGTVTTNSSLAGPGGLGGGGNGNYRGGPSSAESGAANTGGGGGGGSNTFQKSGGAGGSGVVILRLPTSAYSGTTTGSPTVVTEGTDTVLIYKSSGTYVHS